MKATLTRPMPPQIEPGAVAALIPFDDSGRFLATSVTNEIALIQFEMTGNQDVVIVDAGDGSYVTVLPIAQSARGPIDPVADLVRLVGAWTPSGIHEP